jgi:hypothetical protein
MKIEIDIKSCNECPNFKSSVYPTADTTIQVKSDFPVLNDRTWDDLYNYMNDNLNKFQRRSFKEFDYLTVEPSVGAVIFIYLLALAISIGTCIWVTTNDIYE